MRTASGNTLGRPGNDVSTYLSLPLSHPPSFSVGKKLLVFVDDLNMPQVDIYGTQQPIALLKLLLEKGGMYDRGKDLNWKAFKDVVLVAAMGKVGTIYWSGSARL